MTNNDELQTRREFFKKAIRKTLPIIGAITLGPTFMASVVSCGGCDDCKGECEDTCAGSCSKLCVGTAQIEQNTTCTDGSCTGVCKNTCATSCSKTCKSACTTTCGNACKGNSQQTTTCNGNCTGTCKNTCDATCADDCVKGCKNTCSAICSNGSKGSSGNSSLLLEIHQVGIRTMKSGFTGAGSPACINKKTVSIRAYLVSSSGGKTKIKLDASNNPIILHSGLGDLKKCISKVTYTDGECILTPVKSPTWDLCPVTASFYYNGLSAEKTFYLINYYNWDYLAQ